MKKFFLSLLILFIPFICRASNINKTIVISGDYSYPPYEFLENDVPSGFDIELIKEASIMAGYSPVFKLTEWKTARALLEKGEVDALAGMAYSRERAKNVDFSIPYLLLFPALSFEKDKNFRSLDDLKNKKIGIQKGDIVDDYISKHINNIEFVRVTTVQDQVNLLKDKVVDAVIFNSKLQGAYFLSKNNIFDEFNFLDLKKLPVRKYCFAVKKGNTEMLEKLNSSLFMLKANGTFYKLYSKWFGIYEKNSTKTTHTLVTILAVACIILLILMIWSRLLKKKVASKTMELSIEIEKRVKAEMEMKAILDSIGDGVIVTDVELNIVFMNPSAEQILNISSEDIKGKEKADYIILKNKFGKPVELDFKKILIEGKKEFIETPFVLENNKGKEFIVTGNGAPIKNAQGKITGGVFIIRDITREYELERQLQHSQKMDALGRLAGGVAHDFNNLLSGILGVAEILELKLEKTESNVKMIKILKDACKRASDLTSELLTFSKKSPVEMNYHHLHEVVTKAVSILGHGFDKNIEIELDLKADRDIVFMNRSQLENVLINLGVNAKDAMPSGGKIKFSTSNIYLNKIYCDLSPFELTPGDYILLAVKDNGTGVPLAIQKKIFDPFFTTKKKGTGLGLSSVYGMIQQHSGAVNVYSEEGVGTEFHIYLPLDEKAKAASEDNSQIKVDEKKSGTILLVDDESMIRDIGFEILTDAGYKVFTASDGEKAIELFKEKSKEIDLVILDVLMPGMDGSEVLEKLMDIDRNSRVIISSGFYKSTTSSILKEKGAVDFIKKPYSSAKLLQVVAANLTKR